MGDASKRKNEPKELRDKAFNPIEYQPR